MLEQADRVPVAVVEVANLALLVRRGQGDRHRARRQLTSDGHRGYGRGVLRLLPVDFDDDVPDLGPTTSRTGKRPHPGVHQNAGGRDDGKHREAYQEHTRRDAALGVGMLSRRHAQSLA